MNYETIVVEKTRTRYVAPPDINEDGTATREISPWGWCIAGICLVVIVAISFDIFLSTF